MIQIEITIELFGRFCTIAGAEKITMTVSIHTQLKDIITVLIEKYGTDAKPLLLDGENRSLVALFVNNEYVGLKKELQSGDVITLIPILAGG